MKKVYFIISGLACCILLPAQPDQWAVAINPAEVETLLSGRRTIDMYRADAASSPVVDGEKDAIWDNVAATAYDRYVTYHTAYEGGAYVRVSDLSDGPKPLYRTPDNEEDFSGTYRVMYDEDYIYCFLDINDNEVNDNNINPGKYESFEFQEAPYPDSAQQILQGNPYPPYTGTAKEINKKFCYWGYLGAFKFWFYLAADGKCTGEIREKPGAVKIDYSQRFQSCGCAWKPKDDGTGYTAEVSISLRIAMADSANNPYQVPATAKDTQWIAFEMKCYDEDMGRLTIQASWNAEDDNVWDAIIYAGKLIMKGWTVGTENAAADDLHIYPNPASGILFLNQIIEKADVFSVDGMLVKSLNKTDQINIAALPSGFYILKTNNSILTFIKQ